MTTLREAAQQALEALQNLENDDGSIPKHAWDMVQNAINKLCAALASQTVPSDCSDSHQPDAWMTEARNEHGLPVFFCASEVKQAGPGLIPLYTSPPKRKPLTDDEITKLTADTWGSASIAPQSAPEFARAIERAHGIGEKE